MPLDRKAIEDQLTAVREEKQRAETTASEAQINMHRCAAAEYILLEMLKKWDEPEGEPPAETATVTELASTRGKRRR
jgi:hypothetical protein